jgi:hypothetical protein
MSTNITGDWRELFDAALFEPNRARLRECIANAKHAIRSRLDALMRDVPPNHLDENERVLSERIALSDALTTLTELHQIVYSRTSSPATKRQEDSAARPQ